MIRFLYLKLMYWIYFIKRWILIIYSFFLKRINIILNRLDIFYFSIRLLIFLFFCKCLGGYISIRGFKKVLSCLNWIFYIGKIIEKPLNMICSLKKTLFNFFNQIFINSIFFLFLFFHTSFYWFRKMSFLTSYIY